MKFDANARTLYASNESHLCVVNISQEMKRHKILNFIQFVRNYVGNESIKSIQYLYLLTHDEKTKEENHEGVNSFQNLLKHWKTSHSMKNQELCWKCTYGIIDESDSLQLSVKEKKL